MPKFWQIKKIKKWLSLLRQGSSSLPLSQDNSHLPPAKLLSRCEEVTMKQFIACIVDSDFNQLVVSGEPTAEQLMEAWANLFLEYCDLAGHTEVRYRTRLNAEVIAYRAKINAAEACIEHLRVADEVRANIPNVPVNGFIECLKTIGFEDFDLNPNDRAQFLKDLNRIEAELRPDKIRLHAKEIELNEIQKGSTDNEAVERKYFTTIFTRINNYSKREAVNMQTTVEMYCASLRDYVDAIEESKTKN